MGNDLSFNSSILGSSTLTSNISSAIISDALADSTILNDEDFEAVRSNSGTLSENGQISVKYEKPLGHGRYMKSVKYSILFKGKALAGCSGLVLKYFMKPDSSVSFEKELERFMEEMNILKSLPSCTNILPFFWIKEYDRAIYMLRPAVSMNLYDRISTRPFLSLIEKKWIAYQLISCLSYIHEWGIFHGDLRTENVLITSWNWIYLCDFASHKPTFLPQDNPANFSYFFDSSQRRICYLAPERFFDPNVENADFFEIYYHSLSEKMDVFGLGCLLAELFLEGKSLFTLSQLLKYRQNEYDPALELTNIGDKHIEDTIRHMIQLDPDSRWLCSKYLEDSRIFPSFFKEFLHEYVANMVSGKEGKDPDEQITKMYNEFSSLEKYLLRDPVDQGVLIMIGILCTSLNSLTKPQSLLKALFMIYKLTFGCDDVYKVNRVIPFLCPLLSSSNPLIRTKAYTIVSDIMFSVKQFDLAECSDVFLGYLWPQISILAFDMVVMVRIAFAKNLGNMISAAVRIIEMTCIMNSRSSPTHTDLEFTAQESDEAPVGSPDNYDRRMHILRNELESTIVSLLTDPELTVRRAMLHNLPILCRFMGRSKSLDIILSHCITYLNHRDHNIRYDLISALCNISDFVGLRAFREYFIPLYKQAIFDPEEFITSLVLHNLRILTEKQMIDTGLIVEFVTITAPLICHPNSLIRQRVMEFIVCAAKHLSRLDIWIKIMPLLMPVLKKPIFFNELQLPVLRGFAVKPLPRSIFQYAVSWSFKNLSPGKSFDALVGDRLERLTAVSEVSAVTDDDPGSTLKHLGLSEEDEKKLISLKPFLTKLARLKISAQYFDNNPYQESEGQYQGVEAQGEKNKYIDLSLIKGISASPGKTFDALNSSLWESVSRSLLKPLGKAEYTTRTKILENAHANWSPDGDLMFCLNVADDPVTALASDNCNSLIPRSILITGTRGGFLKLWDLRRIEKYGSCQARLIHQIEDIPNSAPTKSKSVTCIRYFEKCQYDLVVSCESGFVGIFRVEVTVKTSGSESYNSITLIRAKTQPFPNPGEYALQHDNYQGRKASLCNLVVMITNENRIEAWDVETDQVYWSLDISFKLGGLESIYVNGRNHWMIVGTSFGVYQCIDLRFIVVFCGWKQCVASSVVVLTGLSGCPNLVLAGCADGRIYLWDIEDCIDDLDGNDEDKDDFDLSTITSTKTLAVFERIIENDDGNYDVVDDDDDNHYLDSLIINIHTFPSECPYLLSTSLDGTISLWHLQDPTNQSMSLQVQTTLIPNPIHKKYRFKKLVKDDRNEKKDHNEKDHNEKDHGKKDGNEKDDRNGKDDRPEKDPITTIFYQQYQVKDSIGFENTALATTTNSNVGDPMLATCFAYHFSTSALLADCCAVPVLCSVSLDGTQIFVSR